MAIFSHYMGDCLYYKVNVGENIYMFPIDTSNKDDIGLAEFRNEEKAIHLMRYIRKAMDNESLIKIK